MAASRPRRPIVIQRSSSCDRRGAFVIVLANHRSAFVIAAGQSSSRRIDI
jgi:hypothetical protein